MAIKLNWERVKQLHDELQSDGWKEQDSILFILIDKSGKPKKATIQFKELYKFLWHISDNNSLQVLTFIMQDVEGKVLYRHRRIVCNEEVPNGGNVDVISHWTALTDDEKNTYITMLAAQIEAYER